MKKLCCMIALAAITFGSVYAGTGHKTLAADTTMKMKKKGMMKKKKMKMKKDTTMSKM